MPSLADLSFISSMGVLVALILTAACIVLLPDWRVALFALAVQYILLGVILTGLVQLGVAAVRVMSGELAAAILYVTMQQRATRYRRRYTDEEGNVLVAPQTFIVGFPFRLFAVALVAVTIIGFASSISLLGLPAHILFSSFWLVSIGLLVAMLSRDALRLGLGILVFTGGFGILDTAIEGSFLLYGLLNVADLLIALVVAHLATLPGEGGPSRRHGDVP